MTAQNNSQKLTNVNTGWNWGAKTAFFYAGTNLLCNIWCWFRLPETRGRPFGEIDLLFENKVHARKFRTTDVDRESRPSRPWRLYCGADSLGRVRAGRARDVRGGEDGGGPSCGGEECIIRRESPSSVEYSSRALNARRYMSGSSRYMAIALRPVKCMSQHRLAAHSLCCPSRNRQRTSVLEPARRPPGS